MLHRLVKNKAKPQNGDQSLKIRHITQIGIVLHTHFTVKRKEKGKRDFFFPRRKPSFEYFGSEEFPSVISKAKDL